MRYLSVFMLFTLANVIGFTQLGYSQETVSVLSDLVGAKAGQAENAVNQRGYTWVKTDKSGDGSYSYWRESGSNKCVSIHTEDGRYQAIVYTMDFDCQKGSSTETSAKSHNAEGECKLWDIKKDYLDMEGDCNVASKKSDSGKEYVVTFDNGKEFRFIPQGSSYKVKMPKEWADHPGYVSDTGSKITFEWAKWKLIANKLSSTQPVSGSDAEMDKVDDENASVRAGEGKFDATGKIPCAQYKGQPMGQCNFGVARDSDGTATVVVTRLDGSKRAIFFEKRKAISADTSQADGYPEFSATKESDLYMIRVGDERYEIPEAVIYGG